MAGTEVYAAVRLAGVLKTKAQGSRQYERRRGSRLEAKFQINLSLLNAAGSSPCERYLLVSCTLHNKILEGSVILNNVDERPWIIFAGSNLSNVCHGWPKLIMETLTVYVLSLLQLRCVMRLWHDISSRCIGLGPDSMTLPACVPLCKHAEEATIHFRAAAYLL